MDASLISPIWMGSIDNIAGQNNPVSQVNQSRKAHQVHMQVLIISLSMDAISCFLLLNAKPLHNDDPNLLFTNALLQSLGISSYFFHIFFFFFPSD
ncbi:hypothetical protein BDV28DRAFT_14448 [Aspergillus coremiiformis]|uniref:Uncharacterized protein n=1 Tax=Aspergillus coremiiformis TaxID=138285 RepID=A0A5N6Z246_9EURO|nr:hypothetical protein BDV28DRAFT_14448 [Aspergillus coremiiformis]